MRYQHINSLIAHGLPELTAGGEVAKKATAEIENDAKHPELKAALQAGNTTSEQWARRIGQAIEEVGSVENAGNPILEAHYEVSKRIRQHAPDDISRYLGIVAAGQLALHYWIASFGTLGNYAAKLGLDTVTQAMQSSLDEAKKADSAHNALAEKLLAA